MGERIQRRMYNQIPIQSLSNNFSNLKPILTSQFFISGISKSIPTQNFKPNEPEISSLPTALHDVNTTPYLSIIELIVEFV